MIIMMHVFSPKDGFQLLSKAQTTKYPPKIAKGRRPPGKAHNDKHISINVNSHPSLTETEGVHLEKVYSQMTISERQEKTKSKEGVKLELLYLLANIRTSPTYMYVVN